MRLCTVPIYLLCLFSASRLQAPTNNPGNPLPRRLDIRGVTAEHDQWCWAACTRMIIGYLLSSPTTFDPSQCQQVASHYPGPDAPDASDACAEPTPTDDPRHDAWLNKCNLRGWPQFEKWGFTACRTTNKGLEWDEIRKELDESRPFIFAVKWTSIAGKGHMFVVIGYHVDDGVRYLDVWDPTPGVVVTTAQFTFETYRDGNVGGAGGPDGKLWPEFRHWDDFYLIKKT
jgi:hypothetical protein